MTRVRVSDFSFISCQGSENKAVRMGRHFSKRVLHVKVLVHPTAKPGFSMSFGTVLRRHARTCEVRRNSCCVNLNSGSSQLSTIECSVNDGQA